MRSTRIKRSIRRVVVPGWILLRDYAREHSVTLGSLYCQVQLRLCDWQRVNGMLFVRKDMDPAKFAKEKAS